MKRLANGMYLLHGLPPFAINVYLMGDVIVDAGTRHAGRRILRQVRGQPVSALALTHAHPDHQGSCHEVCEALGIPRLVRRRRRRGGRGPRADAPAAAAELADPGDRPAHGRAGPPGRADGSARETRSAASPSWRRRGTAPATSPTGVPPTACWSSATSWPISAPDRLVGLREPPRLFSPDPAENRRSARRVAALEPALVCFGHGPPLHDTRRFVEFVGRLALN